MVELIDKTHLEKYPDPHAYNKVYERVLWSLEVLSREMNQDRFSYSEISLFLTDNIGIDTSSQAVRSAIRNIKSGLINIKDNKLKIMEEGRRLIINSNAPTTFLIESGKPFNGKRILINEILKNLSGNICICDSYIGLSTLDLIANIPKKAKIKLLTSNLTENPTGSFKRAFSEMLKEGYSLEVRVYNNSEIHDRYIIADSKMWLIGHSLKDLGKKECFIVEVGKDINDSVSQTFLRRWNLSTPLS